MPTEEELQYFIEHTDTLTEPAVDSTLNWLHHVTPKRRAWNDIFVFAFDHRSQLYDLARQVGAPESRLPALKRKRLSIGVIAGWSAMRYRSAGGFRRSAASTGAV